MTTYGLGDPTKYIKGVPRVMGEAKEFPECPVCGCKTLFRIEVDVEYPKLRGGKGVGQYVRCPACSFGSPMAMISSVVKPGDKFIVKVGLESEKEAG